MPMVWSAWNNGAHRDTGAGYGFKVPIPDRDRHFRPEWKTVQLELPSASASSLHEINVSKKSFWSDTCHELISRDIGRWLIAQGLAPWPKGTPPRFLVESVGDRSFRILGLST
jgi:hypothetical protein